MWDSLHTHTHHTINQIRASQSPSLKSLKTSLGHTLWGSVSEPTWDYRAGSDIICNDPRKSVSHICVIPQKDQSQLRLLAVVNKAQFNLVNTRCRTYHTPTHITQLIKLGHHKYITTSPICEFLMIIVFYMLDPLLIYVLIESMTLTDINCLLIFF